MFFNERSFFTVTDRGNTACLNARGYDIVLYPIGSSLSQSEVESSLSLRISMYSVLDMNLETLCKFLL
jgi:hypothetical protein